MKTKYIVGIGLAGLLLSTGVAVAEDFVVRAEGGVEHMLWREFNGSAVTNRDSGWRRIIEVSAAWDNPDGIGMEGSFKAYDGDGSTTGVRLDGVTNYAGGNGYSGWAAEGRLRYPLAGGATDRTSLVGSLGYETWSRRLPGQREDHSTWFSRLGLEQKLDNWLLVGGVKATYNARLDGHFDRNIGADSNPQLSPKSAVNLYGSVTYNVNERMHVTGYLDGLEFGKAPDVPLVVGGQPATATQNATELRTVGVKMGYAF